MGFHEKIYQKIKNVYLLSDFLNKKKNKNKQKTTSMKSWQHPKYLKCFLDGEYRVRVVGAWCHIGVCILHEQGLVCSIQETISGYSRISV